MWKFFAVALVLMASNSLLTYKQYMDFTRSFSEMRQYGNISVGKDKQYFIYGVVLILACDNNGIVTKGKMMRGVSVLQKFHDFDDLNGYDVYQLRDEEDEKRQRYRRKKRRENGSALLQVCNGLIHILEHPEEHTGRDPEEEYEDELIEEEAGEYTEVYPDDNEAEESASVSEEPEVKEEVIEEETDMDLEKSDVL